MKQTSTSTRSAISINTSTSSIVKIAMLASSLWLASCGDPPVAVAQAGLTSAATTGAVARAMCPVASASVGAAPVSTNSGVASNAGRSVATGLPAAPAARPASPVELRVSRLVVARGVEAREPVGSASSFSRSETSRLYAFVELANPEKAESEILVTFEPEQGDARGHVRLHVGASPRWRTWAATRTVQQPGAWFAVVRTAHDGKELARVPFEITS